MEFETFQVFARYAPLTLAALLDKRGVQPSREILDKLLQVYSRITKEDNVQFYETQTLPDARLLELARQTGLEKDLANLPLELYSLYCAKLDDRERLGVGSQLDEEEIEFHLTFGENSVEYYVLVAGSIRVWNPKKSKLSGPLLLEEDDIGDACDNYLESKGRSFASIDELVTYAQQYQWPNWQMIKTSFEKPYGDLPKMDYSEDVDDEDSI